MLGLFGYPGQVGTNREGVQIFREAVMISTQINGLAKRPTRFCLCSFFEPEIS